MTFRRGGGRSRFSARAAPSSAEGRCRRAGEAWLRPHFSRTCHRHPPHRGFVVQQSYHANLSWPGGGMRRGEGPWEAARRELQEELGLLVDPDALVLARDMAVDWDFRRDRVRVFELRLREEPVLRPDNREVVAARFVDPEALLAEPVLPPFIRAYLTERVGGGGSRSAACGRPPRTPR